MERLTGKFCGNHLKGCGIIKCEEICKKFLDCNKCPIQKAIDKLAEYEQSEEDGLLIKLPCRVGSTVYLINSRYTKCTREEQEFDEYHCQGCEWLDCDSHEEYYIYTNKSVSLEWIVRHSKDIGKTVFLTKAEAEQALSKMKGE